ncbi:deoxynucleoside kinase-like [Homarus americanus]|uniref:deoxynucleoside kinase-like n=1 Tax=Homarus americanus TaxID=6706 RepID=UPI001C446E83|nr:deoxynucleoside kinase-like [Homarus americanus]
MDSSQPFIINIEGNIGSGKSTLISYLKEKLSPTYFEFVSEPLGVWENLLNLMYEDPKKSVHSGLCFVDSLNREEKISDTEKTIYEHAYKLLKPYCHSNLNFYLKCQPQICFQRIVKRQRKGEQNISLLYLKKLHECHEKRLSSNSTAVEILNHDNMAKELFDTKEVRDIHAGTHEGNSEI